MRRGGENERDSMKSKHKNEANTFLTVKAQPRRASANGSTRRTLMTWALARVKTSELQRCKNEGTDIRALAEKGRSENNGLTFEVERLKAELDRCNEGLRRWREEAVRMHKFKDAVENAIAQASNK